MDEENWDTEGTEETDHRGQQGSKGICMARRPRME